jgi:hypothetical protein
VQDLEGAVHSSVLQCNVRSSFVSAQVHEASSSEVGLLGPGPLHSW